MNYIRIANDIIARIKILVNKKIWLRMKYCLLTREKKSGKLINALPENLRVQTALRDAADADP